MKNIFNILLAFLPFVFLCHQLQAAHVSLLSSEDSVASATVVKDIKNYTDKHPTEQLKDLNIRVLHYMGRREEGDANIFVIDSRSYYPFLVEGTTSVTYPGINSSLVITYAEIYLENTDGKVYVARGGIGKSSISLVIVPNKTEGFFNVKGQVYGKFN